MPKYTMGTRNGSSAELKQGASTALSTAAPKAPEQWLCSAAEMYGTIMVATGSSECQVLI